MRNIINPEAIDEFIAISASPRRTLPLALALKALRRPLRSEEALYAPVMTRPDNAPAWMTPERVASGALWAFDMGRLDYDLLIEIQHVMRWLQRGHLRQEMSARERRKWEAGLGHIRTLEEAIRIATRQLAAWGERDLRVHRRERELMMRSRIIKKPAPFAVQIVQGQIVERLRLTCGARWYQLMTAEALAIEAVEMNHCVGSHPYAARLSQGTAAFYSLRGEALAPRLTLMVMQDGHFESRGASNQALNDQDAHHIEHFLKIERPLGIAPGATRHLEPENIMPRQRELRRSSTLAQGLIQMHAQLNERRARRGLPPRPFWSAWRIVDD